LKLETFLRTVGEVEYELDLIDHANCRGRRQRQKTGQPCNTETDAGANLPWFVTPVRTDPYRKGKTVSLLLILWAIGGVGDVHARGIGRTATLFSTGRDRPYLGVFNRGEPLSSIAVGSHPSAFLR
jgi:hypothetical protein